MPERSDSSFRESPLFSRRYLMLFLIRCILYHRIMVCIAENQRYKAICICGNVLDWCCCRNRFFLHIAEHQCKNITCIFDCFCQRVPVSIAGLHIWKVDIIITFFVTSEDSRINIFCHNDSLLPWNCLCFIRETGSTKHRD
nr:MAG TPA: hypothetical protein [Caudoviricetes sp.]DAR09682.1 MAG TPA: hypothetical protein [Caudoviricetes sp.]